MSQSPGRRVVAAPVKPAIRPARPEFSSGPCAKRPGWTAEAVAARAFLGRSHRAAKPKAQLKDAIDRTARAARRARRLPRRHRARPPTPAPSRWRCGRCSAPAPVDMLVWESFGAGLGHRRDQAAEARRLPGADGAPYGALPDLAAVRPEADVCFTWNGTTSGARVPNGDWIAADRAGPDLLRRHLGGLRPGSAVGQARRHHLLLAEGDGRRGRPRRADPQPARRRAAGELRPAAAAAEDLPPDQGRQADRGHLRRRDDQHALDALRRRRGRRARLDGGDRRPRRHPRPRRRELRGAAGLGRPDRLGREPRRRSGGALEHLGLPAGSSIRRSPRATRRRSATSSSG